MRLLALWLLALSCAAPEQVPDWPGSGCESTHRAALGHTLVRGEQTVLEPGLALGVLSPMETGCWPAIVLVPPGIEDGLPILDTQMGAQLSSAGIVVVAYDPSGRGASGGEEDYGGPQHQADLSAVLRWTADLGAVDPTRVTVLSRSLGVAAAAGALGGDASLQVQNLVDLEGPATLPDDLQYVAEQAQETLYQAATGDDWWLARSASESLGVYPGHYMRIQALSDHATGTWVGHALRLMQVAEGGAAATASLNGVQAESWDYQAVQDNALEGRVKVDDARAVVLVLDAVNRGID
ncbi:MAG: hypothetical protein ACI9VR_000591 [Cognaticolwellia sp.]